MSFLFIGLTIAVVRGYCGEETIDKCWKGDQVRKFIFLNEYNFLSLLLINNHTCASRGKNVLTVFDNKSV